MVGGLQRVNLAAVRGARHEPLTWICVSLTLVQAWLLFTPTLKVIVWPDSVGYLGPAVDAIELGYFSHWYGRGWLYPAWLWAWLSIAPEPWIIVWAQRFAVLATFGILCAAMFVLARHVSLSRPPARLLVAVCAGFWLLVYVLYPPTAGLAHAVMPETLFALLLAVVLSGIVTLSLPKVSRKGVVGVTALTIITSSALVLVKPHWLLAACVLPVVLPFIAAPGHRWAIAGTATAALVVSGLLFAIPERRLRERYDPYASRVFGPRVLFCFSSDLIYDHLAKTAADPLSLEVKDALGRMLSPEARAEARDWALLGFNGDECFYGEPARIVARHFADAPGAEASYYSTAYVRAVVSQPAYLPMRLGRHFVALGARPFTAVASDYFVRVTRLRQVEERVSFFSDGSMSTGRCCPASWNLRRGGGCLVRESSLPVLASCCPPLSFLPRRGSFFAGTRRRIAPSREVSLAFLSARSRPMC